MGGIAILMYTMFYFAMSGRNEVKWMFINAGLGIFGIYTQIGWFLSLVGKMLATTRCMCTLPHFYILFFMHFCCGMPFWIYWARVEIQDGENSSRSDT